MTDVTKIDWPEGLSSNKLFDLALRVLLRPGMVRLGRDQLGRALVGLGEDLAPAARAVQHAMANLGTPVHIGDIYAELEDHDLLMEAVDRARALIGPYTVDEDDDF